ncbi:Rieske (2Fe-2S) protein [Streptomyces sp. NPDC002795]|uniref:Rieske (2Fe-2S) protein n=1 Tax=Streptomyces sp. NPDC002795 TaxID=3364665 RepID=UPI003678A436
MRRTASRRSVLVAGTAALAAGCSKYGDEDQGGGGDEAAETSEAPASSEKGSGDGSGDSQQPPAADELTKTSAIPVGGGKIFPDDKVVVTQPAEGDFKAFSAVCTHQGCAVKDVSGGTINCPCHGSKFKVTDASVAGGPATRPLDTRQIKVTGDSITLA